MKFISITTILILFLFSCKKKEEVVDKCKNGYKDAGELGIDCGGNCGPCPTVYIPSAQCTYNGSQTSFHTKTLAFANNNYTLTMYNDSIYIQLNLGVGIHPLLSSGSLITKSGSAPNFTYSNISNATFYVTSDDATDQRMSGLFNLNFYPTGASASDTVRITSGSFDDLKY